MGETDDVKCLSQTLHNLQDQVPALRKDLAEMRDRLAVQEGLFKGFDGAVRTVAALVRDLDRWVRPVLQSIVDARSRRRPAPSGGNGETRKAVVRAMDACIEALDLMGKGENKGAADRLDAAVGCLDSAVFQLTGERLLNDDDERN